MTQPAGNTSPAASGQQGHLGELTAAAAILLLLRHADQAEALEHRAAAAPVRAVRHAAVTITRQGAAAWVRKAGSLSAPLDPIASADLTAQVVQSLRHTRPDPGPLLDDGVRAAYQLGSRQAATALNQRPPAAVEAPAELVDQTRVLTDTVTRRWGASERLLTSTPIETHDDLTTALAPLHAAGSDVDRDARTLVNTAVNRASQDTAATHDVDLLWESLRDACVVCLALSGTVVGHLEDFPADATFGDKPTPWWTPPGHVGPLRPPRHPRCRCKAVPYLGHTGPPGSLTLPEALKREAERSILRGFSVPSESEQVRLRAADRLLARGTNLPKTVRAYARHAVERGHFPTRRVPNGG